MRLLINLCGHDGIISHYNGVGTMCMKYIDTFTKVLDDMKIEYDLNLFTPEYNENSFGYDKNVEQKHNLLRKTKIYQVANNSNGKVNYGTINHWKILCKNTANIINNLELSNYDFVLTIYNDTPFACLANYLNVSDNHKTVLILHSTIKIHEVDSAIENSEEFYLDRLKWEKNAVDYINKTKNCYMGVIGEFITQHLIQEYNLNKNKVLKLYNGELFLEKNKKYSDECQKLFESIKDLDEIIISFGRAEQYKNLSSTFKIGKKLNIKPIVISQLYYKEQPILKEYQKNVKLYDGILYVDPPFDYANYILNNFKKNIICLIPSKKEIQGLIINEVRNLNKDNILIVANNINGLKEQITDKYDGILVDVDNIEESCKKIKKYFKGDEIRRLNRNSQKTLHTKYDFYNNVKEFLLNLLGNNMEYEYSFKVSGIEEYIKYCQQKDFNFVTKSKQTRIIYRNKNKTMARITIEEGNVVIKKLDFKEDKITNNDLNVRKESASLTFENESEIKSILNFLEYKEDNTLIRTRTIYEKGSVKFEIDEYEYPENSYVIAIEGDKINTDKVYEELAEINKKYKI